jgi:hypothetical protein
VVEISGVECATGRDLVAWSSSPQPFGFGPLPFDAAAAWVRESAAGERTAFRACGVPGPSAGQGNGTGCGWVMWDARGEIIAGRGDEP